ncbi:MAG: flagellar FlbD family protein, partial [Bdellovibrionales bacterium]|nr:flagellar FlbD family protein [Bdellovibrionales bacterium]
MIQVSKINGQKVWINSDLIRTIDQIPETRIVFIDDVIILVQETPEMIRGKIINFKSNF